MARAWRRLAGAAWPLLHCAAAATLAWAIAHHFIHHHRPFFAPIAAMVALNAALGERGMNAALLLLGVVIGILTGEAALAVLGSGTVSLGLATFTAMAIAVALGGARIAIAEAASGAILTVALANGEVGTERLEDAVIGAGVALVFSQLLFAPEPVGLVRRAEAAALAEMAAGVRLTADMLGGSGDLPGVQALTRLRDLRDHLSELSRTRRASTRVVRRSAIWRTRMAPVVRENENAGHLDLLGGSCLVLARTALAVGPPRRHDLAPSVRQLAEALCLLAARPGDRAHRQHAVDRAAHAVHRLAAQDAPPSTPAGAAAVAVRLVATDIMIFSGTGRG